MAYQAFAQVYDRLMRDMPYDAWLRFTRAYWERHGFRPVTVVELGCGTGNIAVPLARDGYRVIGIDVSDSMLAAAQAKTARSGKADSARWILQDMREWELGFPVDAVVSFCDSLNYLTEPEDVRAAFRQTFAGLRPGGLFLFDVHPPATLKRYADEQPFALQEDDIAYLWTCGWDEERMEIEHHLTVFVQGADGRYDRIDEWQVQRAYPLERLVEWLKEAGFTDVECFADFAFAAPDGRSVRWFIGARRP
jgi:SAM-dependent methyltransferase